MAYIVLSENRPFSFVDFLDFKVDGKQYNLAYGTIRNKFYEFRKLDKIVLSYRSNRAFYTLKDYEFGKPMTIDHRVVHNDPFYRFLQNLPLDKQSIHDIRLRFSVPGLWILLSNNQKFHRNERSQDIVIPSWISENVIIRIFIHKTDTVSIILGCSLKPIPLDFNGIICFFILLARTEEKLKTILDNCSKISCNKKYNSIPEYTKWIVTQWHFGQDELMECTGKKFSITTENAQHILNRVYSKDFGNKTRIRRENQEYPNRTAFDAIEEKLSCNFQS